MRSKSTGLQVPHLLREIFETVIVFLYPARCRVCEAFLEVASIPFICPNCWHNIQFLEPPWCDICGTPNVNRCCDECAISPPRYGKLRSIALYQTTLQQAIHLFKFEKKKVFARHLDPTDERTHSLRIVLLQNTTFILPVPIHKKRLRERGFNQATCYSPKALQQAEGVPILTRCSGSTPAYGGTEQFGYGSPSTQYRRRI